MGAALGLVIGLIVWGSGGSALVMVFGSAVGLVVGAVADARSRSSGA